MRTIGSPIELQRRRILAVERHREGYAPDEIASFLGVSERSVWRWLASCREDPESGLSAREAPGRPPRLNAMQQRVALKFLRERPTDFGYPTDLRTAAKVGHLIHEIWGVRYSPRYLSAWLTRGDCTPQKPRRVPRERKQEALDAWCEADWQRIQKTSGIGVPTC